MVTESLSKANCCGSPYNKVSVPNLRLIDRIMCYLHRWLQSGTQTNLLNTPLWDVSKNTHREKTECEIYNYFSLYRFYDLCWCFNVFKIALSCHIVILLMYGSKYERGNLGQSLCGHSWTLMQLFQTRFGTLWNKLFVSVDHTWNYKLSELICDTSIFVMLPVSYY